MVTGALGGTVGSTGAEGCSRSGLTTGSEEGMAGALEPGTGLGAADTAAGTLGLPSGSLWSWG